MMIAGYSAPAQKNSLPDGPGKDVVMRVCGTCHAIDLITGKGNTRDGWTQVVGVMIARGAQGSDEDFGTIVEYLATYFPPKSEVKKVNVNKAAAAELESGLALTQKEADSIVEYRKQNGDFKSLEDLKKVPNLDQAKLAGLKDKISFE